MGGAPSTIWLRGFFLAAVAWCFLVVDERFSVADIAKHETARRVRANACCLHMIDI